MWGLQKLLNCRVMTGEHFLLANGIEEDSKQCHLLLALIGNSTFKLLTNLVAPKKPEERSNKEI